jgi:hypothetical protein
MGNDSTRRRIGTCGRAKLALDEARQLEAVGAVHPRLENGPYGGSSAR